MPAVNCKLSSTKSIATFKSPLQSVFIAHTIIQHTQRPVVARDPSKSIVRIIATATEDHPDS